MQDKFDEEAKRQRVAEFIVEPKPQLQVKIRELFVDFQYSIPRT